MGGRSSSNSSQSSSQSSFSQGLYGDNNGVNVAGSNNTVNYLDGGAIDSSYKFAGDTLEFANQTANAMAGVASESLSLADSLGSNAMQYGYELGSKGINAGVDIAGNTQQFALSAISENSNIVNQYGDLASTMLDSTLASNNNTINNTAMLLDNANARTLDSALNFTQSSVYQTELNNNLARDLVAMNGEASLEQQRDNNNALTNGFKSMMQFADSYSRSDGASIAESNNKMIMYVVGGLVISAFIYKKIG